MLTYEGASRCVGLPPPSQPATGETLAGLEALATRAFLKPDGTPTPPLPRPGEEGGGSSRDRNPASPVIPRLPQGACWEGGVSPPSPGALPCWLESPSATLQPGPDRR